MSEAQERQWRHEMMGRVAQLVGPSSSVGEDGRLLLGLLLQGQADRQGEMRDRLRCFAERLDLLTRTTWIRPRDFDVMERAFDRFEKALTKAERGAIRG